MDHTAQIAQTKQTVQKASADLLNTLSFVPDDKLTYSPSDTSRHSLWIVGHCAMANKAFAAGIRGEALPVPENPADFSKMVWVAGKDTTSRAQAIELIEESTAEVQAALDGLTAEGLASSVTMPFGPLPMTYWITFSGMHMEGHARQVDYLQTIWGDTQDHMMG